MLASREGREALDVDAEQSRERVGLGLAQLGELSRDMMHRAVTLAHLYAGPRPLADRTRGRGEPVAAQRRDQGLRPSGGRVTDGGQVGGIPGLEVG